MATFIERGGRTMARVRRDGFKPVAKTFTKRSDAERWARGVESDMERGRWVDPSEAVPTMAEALKLYRAGAVKALKGADTYGYWLDELNSAAMARKPVNEVTSFDVSAWRDAQQSKGLAAGTVVRKLGLLGGFFSWCLKERGWLSTNPMEAVRKPRVSDARDRVLSDDERAYLLTAAASSRAHWLADALVVLLQSAMRRSELWGLKVGDVDTDSATAHLSDTKNGSARDVPLCPQALAAVGRLADAAKQRNSEEAQPVSDPQTLSLIPVSDPHAVSLAFRRTLARARTLYLKDCAEQGVKPGAGVLEGVRLHDLRHTAATAWAGAGLTVFELRQVTGHKDVRMVGRYVSMSASKLAGKLATLTASSAASTTSSAASSQGVAA